MNDLYTDRFTNYLMHCTYNYLTSRSISYPTNRLPDNLAYSINQLFDGPAIRQPSYLIIDYQKNRSTDKPIAL